MSEQRHFCGRGRSGFPGSTAFSPPPRSVPFARGGIPRVRDFRNCLVPGLGLTRVGPGAVPLVTEHKLPSGSWIDILVEPYPFDRSAFLERATELFRSSSGTMPSGCSEVTRWWWRRTRSFGIGMPTWSINPVCDIRDIVHYSARTSRDNHPRRSHPPHVANWHCQEASHVH
jgi:hypothetical protein